MYLMVRVEELGFKQADRLFQVLRIHYGPRWTRWGSNPHIRCFCANTRKILRVQRHKYNHAQLNTDVPFNLVSNPFIVSSDFSFSKLNFFSCSSSDTIVIECWWISSCWKVAELNAGGGWGRSLRNNWQQTSHWTSPADEFPSNLLSS